MYEQRLGGLRGVVALLEEGAGGFDQGAAVGGVVLAQGPDGVSQECLQVAGAIGVEEDGVKTEVIRGDRRIGPAEAPEQLSRLPGKTHLPLDRSFVQGYGPGGHHHDLAAIEFAMETPVDLLRGLLGGLTWKERRHYPVMLSAEPTSLAGEVAHRPAQIQRPDAVTHRRHADVSPIQVDTPSAHHHEQLLVDPLGRHELVKQLAPGMFLSLDEGALAEE